MLDFLRELLLSRKMRMLWKIEDNSYLVAAAHFYNRPYKSFLRGFIPKFEKVVFEGKVEPLHELDALAKGKSLGDLLDAAAVERIKNKVGTTLVTDFAHVDTGELVYAHAMRFEPWAGFLVIWLNYLEKKGWRYSMEADALRIAKELNKPVYTLETLEEQITALRKMPWERITAFLGKVDEWDSLLKKFQELYDKGDLVETLRVTADYPTRIEEIIEKRDVRLYERMKPFIEDGGALFLIGMAHCPGMLKMISEDGYRVKHDR